MRKEKRQAEGLHLDRRRVRAYVLRMEKAIESGKRPSAVGYCRVSSRKQADEGGSIEAQREAIIREAVLGGFNLLDVYSDGGLSGGRSEKTRPGLALTLEAIRSGRAAVLIVKHVDRLSRDTDYTGHLRTVVKEAGARLVVIEEAKDDPIRKAVDTMLGELEKIRGSQRMKGFHAARKARGLHSGAVGFGTRTRADGRLEPDPAMAGTVARILRLRAQGASLRAIAAALNADEVPGPTKARWNAETINGVVKRQGGTP
jgi:site-specific DNA recombinase